MLKGEPIYIESFKWMKYYKVKGKTEGIYFTMNNPEGGSSALLVGPGSPDAGLCQADSAYTAAPSNNLVTATTPLTGGGEIAQQRVACHFYKV